MTDVSTNYDQKPVGRPTFLTVLCILTFIGSGWGLISSTMGYFAADKQSSTITAVTESAKEDLKKAGARDEAGAKIAEQMMSNLTVLSPENLKKSAIGGVIAAVFCLAGAFMMWGLKKSGFYVYVLGTIVGIAAPIVIFGMGNIFALGMTAVGGFIGLIFVVLYGLNLKYMK